MRYVSFCSGVEAASQAWEPLGWEPVAFSEIEPFPCAVLAARYPAVPNLGDCRNIHYDRNTKELYVRDKDGTERDRFFAGDIDLCVGGFPCQSFSVAGKREGLEGASGLILEYFRLLAEIRPRWVVYENVPGMLSSNGGADFRLLLRKFAECGYDVCWRTLDTQYVRVEQYPLAIPQRRRRVFLVGRLAAAGGCGCEVLLEWEGLRGDPPPRRVKGRDAARDPAACARGADGAVGVECLTSSGEHPQTHRVYGTGGAYPPIMSNGGQSGQDQRSVLVRDAISFKGGQSAAGGLGVDDGACQTMQSKMSALEPTVAISFLPTNSSRARSLGDAEEVAPTVASASGGSGNKPSVATRSVAVRTGHTAANGCGFQDEVTHTLGAVDRDAVACEIAGGVTAYENHATASRVIETDVAPTQGATRNGNASNNNPLVGYRYAVRRITPVEAERLQGFADGWTVPAFAEGAVTDALCDRFAAVHRAWAAINGRRNAKAKGRNEIRRWLERISSPATCPDGPRYKAIGNSMSVNAMQWVGMRIALADAAESGA